jgi:integrase
MVTAKLKGINRVLKRLADGSTAIYFYHRATGERLPGKPGEREFIAAYAAAERRYSERHCGTFNQLTHLYSASPQFADLAESTRKEYARMLRKAEERFGSMPRAALDDPRVKQDFLRWRHSLIAKPRAADNHLSVISSMLTWAVEAGELTTNHLAGFKRAYHSDRADKIWLVEHITAFMAVAPLEMQRALIMALHTGQRQGDILRMAWGNYDGGYITVRQGKSGFTRQVEIPVTATLRKMLDGIDRTGTVILTTKTGRPWKARHFKREWAETTAKAGITDLHFHDLRGTAVTMLAEAGCTVPQIAAITGHNLEFVSTILERYLARTRPLADGAITLFQNAKATEFANRLQTRHQSKAEGEAK